MTGARPEDHRTRVGHERRRRMRARLIEAATLVFAERGPEATQIDDVIREAGVSRGTFYNYFRSTDELLHAAVDALAGEMVALVGAASDPAAPPAERFADGLKAFVDLATRHPLLLDFLGGLGLGNLGADVLVPALSTADLTPVIHPDVAETLSPSLASDIVEAATLALLLRLRSGARVDVPGFAAAMLRSLGHPAPDAARLAARPVSPLDIPAGSLIVRSATARAARS